MCTEHGTVDWLNNYVVDYQVGYWQNNMESVNISNRMYFTTLTVCQWSVSECDGVWSDDDWAHKEARWGDVYYWQRLRTWCSGRSVCVSCCVVITISLFWRSGHVWRLFSRDCDGFTCIYTCLLFDLQCVMKIWYDVHNSVNTFQTAMLQWTFLGLLLVHDWLDDNTGLGHKHWVANVTFYADIIFLPCGFCYLFFFLA